MGATPLEPSEWRRRLEAVNKIDRDSDLTQKDYILLDVRNGNMLLKFFL